MMKLLGLYAGVCGCAAVYGGVLVPSPDWRLVAWGVSGWLLACAGMWALEKAQGVRK